MSKPKLTGPDKKVRVVRIDLTCPDGGNSIIVLTNQQQYDFLVEIVKKFNESRKTLGTVPIMDFAVLETRDYHDCPIYKESKPQDLNDLKYYVNVANLIKMATRVIEHFDDLEAQGFRLRKIEFGSDYMRVMGPPDYGYAWYADLRESLKDLRESLKAIESDMAEIIAILDK